MKITVIIPMLLATGILYLSSSHLFAVSETEERFHQLIKPSEAPQVFREHIKKIGKLVDDKDWKALCEEIREIKAVAELLPKSEGESKLEHRLLVDRIHRSAERLIGAADAQDRPKAKKEYENLKTIVNYLKEEIIEKPGNRTQESGYYSCVLHPDIMEKNAGNCPKCGIELIKTKPNIIPIEEALVNYQRDEAM